MRLALTEQFGRAREKRLIATGAEKLESVSGSVEKSNHRYKSE